MIERFLAALQFLTLFPIHRTPRVSLGQSAVFFPVIGGLLGIAAGAVSLSLQPFLGPSIGALVAITLLFIATGGLHEEALADVADAFRAGRSTETIFRILKDSRIGAYGASALVLSMVLRWQFLAASTISSIPTLGATLVLSRTAMVALAWLAPAKGEGLGLAFAHALSRRIVLITITLAIALVCLSAPTRSLALLLCTTLVTFAARSYFVTRIGGITGDCLGATCQIVEASNLLVLAWHPST